MCTDCLGTCVRGDLHFVTEKRLSPKGGCILAAIWGIWPCASLRDQVPIQEWLNSFETGYTCICTRFVKPAWGLEEQALLNLGGVFVEDTSSRDSSIPSCSL